MKALPPAEAPDAVVQAQRHARASGLLYVSDAEPGILRQRRGVRDSAISERTVVR